MTDIPATQREGPSHDGPGARQLVPQTVRESPGVPSGPAPTQREGSSSDDDQVGGWLPSAVAARYRLIKPLASSGAEAELYIVDALDGSGLFVAKIYHMRIELDPDTIKRLKGAELEHVVGIVDIDRSDGRWYEILEYIEAGSLTNLLASEGPVVPADTARDILVELLDALEHLHALGVVHRDLKPDNVLVRTRRPSLDLVLTDFGLAAVTEGSQRFASASRTVAYAAPEAFAGKEVIIGPFRDYWALGIIVIEMLTGEHPFAGLSEAVAGLQITTRRIDVSGVPGEAWQHLCRGLLTQAPEHRWGAEQIRAWLGGEQPAVHDVAPVAPAVHPFMFQGTEHTTPRALAAALATSWEEAKKRYARRDISTWLRRNDFDLDWINAIDDLDNSIENPDLRLLLLLLKLDPDMPPLFQGLDIEIGALPGLAGAALANGPQGAELTIVDRLFRYKVLSAYGKAANRQDLIDLDERWHVEDAAGVACLKLVPADLERPDARMARARLLAAVASLAEEDRLHAEALAVDSADARGCDWFSALGDVYTDGPGCLLVISLFGEIARVRTVEKRRSEGREQESRALAAKQSQRVTQQKEAQEAARREVQRRRIGSPSRKLAWSGVLGSGVVLVGVLYARASLLPAAGRFDAPWYDFFVAQVVDTVVGTYGTQALIVASTVLMCLLMLAWATQGFRTGSPVLKRVTVPFGAAGAAGWLVVGGPLLYVVGTVVAGVAIIVFVLWCLAAWFNS